MSTSPTELTLNRLRKEGWTAAVVEKWKPCLRKGKLEPYGVRVDLFGLFDVLAFNDFWIVGIQATSASNHASRVKKMRANPLLEAWLRNACRFAEVWTFRQKKKGARWIERREDVTASGGGGYDEV